MSASMSLTDKTAFGFLVTDVTRLMRKHFDRRAVRFRPHARAMACAQAPAYSEGMSQSEFAEAAGNGTDRHWPCHRPTAESGLRRTPCRSGRPPHLAIVSDRSAPTPSSTTWNKFPTNFSGRPSAALPRRHENLMSRAGPHETESYAAMDDIARKAMTENNTTSPAAEVLPAKKARKKRNLVLWIRGSRRRAVVGAYLYVTSRPIRFDGQCLCGSRSCDHRVAGPRPRHRGARARKSGSQERRCAFPIDCAAAGNRRRAHTRRRLDSVHSLLEAARDGFHFRASDCESADEALRINQRHTNACRNCARKRSVAQKDVDDAANNLANARGTRDSDVAALSPKRRSLIGGLPTTPDEKLAALQIRAGAVRAGQTRSRTCHRACADGRNDRQAESAAGRFSRDRTGGDAADCDASRCGSTPISRKPNLTNVGSIRPATVEVDTYPGKKWQAHVASISPASGAEFSILPPQNATGNWVKIVQRIPVRVVDRRPRPRSDSARGHERHCGNRYRQAEFASRPHRRRREAPADTRGPEVEVSRDEQYRADS